MLLSSFRFRHRGIAFVRYQLLFGEEILGEVLELERDFPSFHGSFDESAALSSKQSLSLVSDYIDYSRRVWPLVEADQMDDPAFEDEHRFTELIESAKWALLDADGERIPILIPIFTSDQQLIWRLDSRSATRG